MLGKIHTSGWTSPAKTTNRKFKAINKKKTGGGNEEKKKRGGV